MIEFIILGILALAFIGFAYFVYQDSQKKTGAMMKQMNDMTQMLMAGSYQAWDRAKKGKKPLPNTIKNVPNFKELTEGKRIPWGEITGVEVDSAPRRKVKIYT